MELLLVTQNQLKLLINIIYYIFFSFKPHEKLENKFELSSAKLSKWVGE